MGGDTGGNDCVHVFDVRVDAGAALRQHTNRRFLELRPDTDVAVADEHGYVCQFTYQEFYDHVIAVKSGAHDGIAMNGVPEQGVTQHDLVTPDARETVKPDPFDQPPGRRAGIGMGVHPDAIIDGYGFDPERDR